MDWTRRLVVVIVLNAMFSLMPIVSWQAHLGGTVGGFATALLLSSINTGKRPLRLLSFGLLLGLAASCILGLAASMAWGKHWAGYRQFVAEEKRRVAVEAAEEKRLADRRAAEEGFNREVAPLLDQLKPTGMLTSAQRIAINQLNRPGPRRNAARVAERARQTDRAQRHRRSGPGASPGSAGRRRAHRSPSRRGPGLRRGASAIVRALAGDARFARDSR